MYSKEKGSCMVSKASILKWMCVSDSQEDADYLGISYDLQYQEFLHKFTPRWQDICSALPYTAGWAYIIHAELSTNM